MKVEYSNRAASDLCKVAADSRPHGDAVTAAVKARIRQVVAQVAEHPESAPRVEERPGVHVIPLIRFPYKIFYRLFPDRVRSLHIRHTSRRPWA